jgi:erythromycin esterase
LNVPTVETRAASRSFAWVQWPARRDALASLGGRKRNLRVYPPRCVVLALLVSLTACSPAPLGASAAAPSPARTGEPSDAPAPAPPSPLVLLSEGFEGDTARWYLGGKGEGVGVDSAEAHEGKGSLRLFHEAVGSGVSSVTLPATDARGKEAVLSGWIKTDSVEGGFAGLWLRVDGANGAILALDNMQGTNLHGTAAWTRYEVVVAVPPEAEHLVLGALLTGKGAVWVDDLRLSVRSPRSRERVRVGGLVRDAEGKPVAGALVAIVPPEAARAEATTTTDEHGRFLFTVLRGRYAFTATAAGLAAGYRPMASFDTAATGADVNVGVGAAFTITGKVLLSGAAPHAGIRVTASRWSDSDGDLFYAATDPSGAFALTLPGGSRYFLTLDEPNATSIPVQIADGADQRVDLAASARSPAPDAVVDWMTKAAIPIATTDPAHDVTDLEPLGGVIGSASVVGLGEATHGTREFFQLKHRVLEYLVERQGFRVFAIEANYPESLAVNDYVLHGTGDPRKALAGMYFWMWNTEEVLAQVEWMRRWNNDPKHPKKVKFVGFDMQTACVGVARVLDYLARVEPAVAKEATASLSPLGTGNESTYEALPAERRAATGKAISDLLDLFDHQKKVWIARSSPAAWVTARQHAVIVAQAERGHARDNADWRDESMATNVRSILDNEPKGTRMVVWAHNGHVARSGALAWTPMGSHLAKDLGGGYVALGFAFDRGAFQATNGKGGFGEYRVGESPLGDVAEAFRRVHLPLFALDLRGAPSGRRRRLAERPPRHAGNRCRVLRRGRHEHDGRAPPPVRRGPLRGRDDARAPALANRLRRGPRDSSRLAAIDGRELPRGGRYAHRPPSSSSKLSNGSKFTRASSRHVPRRLQRAPSRQNASSVRAIGSRSHTCPTRSRA